MVQAYLTPKTVKEAIEMLASYQGRARIIAGGTDLVLDIKSGKYDTEYLIDITKIKEVSEIVRRGEILAIGSAATHNRLAADPDVLQGAFALAKASSMVGSNQIRNCSTLGGNVVNAQPAADSGVALAALGAKAEIFHQDGIETVSVESLYAGFGKSTVDSSKSLITEFLVPVAGEGEGSSYVRLQQRKALALPMLCVGVWIKITEKRVVDVRIVMAPVGIGPVRAVSAEQALIGKIAEGDIWKMAGRLAPEDANPRDSLVRGSREYRMNVLPSLVEQALSEAVNMAWNRGKEGEL